MWPPRETPANTLIYQISKGNAINRRWGGKKGHGERKGKIGL